MLKLDPLLERVVMDDPNESSEDRVGCRVEEVVLDRTRWWRVELMAKIMTTIHRQY